MLPRNHPNPTAANRHMSHTIVISPQSPDTLWDAVLSAQAGYPLEPVTVVGPSNYANLSLRHSFARRGFANVRFMAFPRLAELLGARALAAQGMTPLSPVLESAATRAVSDDATGALRSVRSHPMTHQSLKFAFRQLRRVSDAALDRLQETGGLPADTVALYRKYRDKTSAFYDAERLAGAAADSVRDGSATALDDLGFIIFFHLREMTAAQRQLVSALVDRNRCAVMLNATGDDDADKPIAGIAAALEIPHNLERAAEDEQNRSSARLVIAPDPHQEIRWAIRHIMSLAGRGVPFHRMAVLYRQTAPYGALVGEEMQIAGIPVAGPGRATLADTGAGRALSGLMEIADGEFARAAVAAWFTGSPVKSPTDTTDDNPSARFNPGVWPSRWDKLSKQAGIVGGKDQWLNRLQLYADNQNQRADDGEKQGEIDEGRAGWMRRDAEIATALREFIQDLAERVSPPPDGSAWSDFVGWAKGLLSAYVAIPADADQPEHDALDKINSGLDTLVVAGEIEPEPDFTSFWRALDELLSQVVGHLGSIGQGVFVAPIRQAAGMRFDYLHVVGMVEGAMPPALRDDPLIPDVARQEVGGAAAELPTRAERRALERYDYLAALATAPDATLSYPVADPAGGRANSPSRWLLEQASQIHGENVYASDLPKLSEEAWLTILPSFEAALAATPETGHADLADYELERLWRWSKAGLPPRDHPLVAHARDHALPRSLALSSARYGGEFTEWDGNVSAAARGARFADSLLNRVHSPTSLQNWAKCPFSYFLGNALRLGDTESPEDAHSITPLDKGNLVHKMLEEFMRQVLDAGTMPAHSEPWSADHRRLLLDIAKSKFEEAQERGVTGKPVMWQLESDSIRADLVSFLEMDNENRAKFGVAPAYVEAAFGVRGGAWRAASWPMEDGETIKLRGFIDRVDVSPDGRSALVFDYKTGSSNRYNGLGDDPTDRGKLLQLGAYALAAEQALGEDVDVRSAYWFPTSRGGFKLMPSEPLNLGDEDKRQRFGQVFATLASGVRGGIFPANPGKDGFYGSENCGYCDFDSLCPSRRAVLWSKKKNDEAVAEYVELAEGDLE